MCPCSSLVHIDFFFHAHTGWMSIRGVQKKRGEGAGSKKKGGGGGGGHGPDICSASTFAFTFTFTFISTFSKAYGKITHNEHGNSTANPQPPQTTCMHSPLSKPMTS